VREVKVATLSTQNALRAATPAQPLKGILKTGEGADPKIHYCR